VKTVPVTEQEPIKTQYSVGKKLVKRNKVVVIIPSKSKAERRLMGLALHNPDKVYPENKGVLKMTKKQLHDFASTKEKGLPEKVKKKHPRKKVSKKK
jgi:hypothetical protein